MLNRLGPQRKTQYKLKYKLKYPVPLAAPVLVVLSPGSFFHMASAASPSTTLYYWYNTSTTICNSNPTTLRNLRARHITDFTLIRVSILFSSTHFLVIQPLHCHQTTWRTPTVCT
ncbi:hypothetical protein M405DRAFT_13340 [Rhizopogon salebrosus TDB-379]|nr:hypothetical protein M405DRAFT_13340 [Rhizopogon salebrosus TDB-379]